MNDHTPNFHGFKELAAMLRAHACGLYGWEAAAELLISHETWLRRPDFTSRCITVDHHAAGGFAALDYLSALMALDSGQLPCSGSEAHILRIAASLAANTTVNLGQAVGGLDARNLRLVLAAIAHANGHRDTEVRLG